jgi:uncharacterized protein (DUF885 family)
MRSTLPILFALAFAPSIAGQDMRSLIEQYSADAALFNRHWSASNGSAAALDREQKLWEGRLKRLSAIEFGKLRLDQQVDYLLMRNDLKATLHRLDHDRKERDELAPWLPFRTTIEGLGDARVAGKPPAARDAAAALAPLTKATVDMQSKVKALRDKKPAEAGSAGDNAISLPTPYQAARAAEVTDELRELLKKWFENYNGFLPDFNWWTRQPYEEATKALEAYAKYLREEVAGVKSKDDGPLLGRPVGEEVLLEQLRFEVIPYTPQELIAIGEREFAWCEGEMKRAAREMNPGDDWQAALKKVKEMHVGPGEQEAMVREEGRRGIAFVKQHKLVTVPPECEEWWGTRMLSPQEQKQIPYAAYSGHEMLVAFANTNMEHEDKIMAMRGNNRPFMRNVVPHELIPGHHLQSFMAARHRPYRRGFGTPFFIEGWALYWEMLLYDMGYHQKPEDRIGALFWRMHRCARIIVSLKYHLGEMKPDEMVRFLTERVGHEKFGATSEVRRFIAGHFPPLYQAAYMIGGLQLMALHRELVAPGKMTEQQFHDAVLRLGPIPVELIRASLTQGSLAADYQPQWRFDIGLPAQE